MNSSRQFWSFSAIYLLYFMFSALPSGMLTPLMSHLGYTSQQIGFLFSMGAISGILISTLISRFADRFRKLKPFVILSLIVSIALIGTVFRSVAPSLLCFLSGIAVAAFSRLISSLLDSWALESDEAIRVRYGAIRAFGSIGFAIGLGVLVQFVTRSGYQAIFPISMILGSLLVLLLAFTPDVKPATQAWQKPKLKSLFSLDYGLWVLIFFFVFFVIGVEDMTITMKMLELGAGPTQIAWFYSAQALFELPLFFFGARLMRRYGAKKLLVLAILALASKMFLFAATQQVSAMLGLTMIQFFTFPLIMITSKAIIYTASDPAQKISGQVIGVAIYGNLSGILAPLLIGAFVKLTSASLALVALGGLLGIPLMMILVLALRQRQQRLAQQ